KPPETVKVLKLDMRVLWGSITFGPTLTHVSLILHFITDVIVRTIAQSCPLLVELELIDIPTSQTAWSDELSDDGKFDIQYGLFFTDLAFRDVSKVHRSLVEVKLVSCGSITGEGVSQLVTSSCTSLEVLDLRGCKLVADSCLRSVSCLALLSSLNLGGTNVTDAHMASLGKGSAPISYTLCWS
nr:hypothetical protein [Tanacetum cinerariifolium]